MYYSTSSWEEAMVLYKREKLKCCQDKPSSFIYMLIFKCQLPEIPKIDPSTQVLIDVLFSKEIVSEGKDGREIVEWIFCQC